ncbi:MAG: SH3 domain-containing protein [Bdellovibrionaceae bacterium]|nr:SH3 domain-containing protein [Pseudobdellovibrionaceae bacterium]MBX3034747.1 SH3 domain-containing protein [Pseudobdellovibrionaceae bacterium]
MKALLWTLPAAWMVLFTPPRAGALTVLPSATSFYRSQNSLFASGQTSRANLEKKLLRQEQETHLQVKWDKRDFTLRDEDVIRDLQCAKTVLLRENSQLLADSRGDAGPRGEVSRGARAELLQTRPPWARIRARGQEGWLPLSRLENVNDDPGVFVALIDTFVRERAADAGRVLTTLPRGARVTPLAHLAGGWIRARVGEKTGFIDSHHLVGRADFATWAWRHKHGWVLVSHREGDVLKTRDGKNLPLAEVTGYNTDPRRAVVSRLREPGPPLRAHVEIQRTDATVWAVSQLDGHGEVWWKKQNLVVSAGPARGDTLSTEELLKRHVFSYSLVGTQKIQGLVSAKGVWKTEDGATWTRLSQFGDQDLPVAIRGRDGWFVGVHQSRDRGESFEPYLRWDLLSRNIESKLQRPPRYVRLQKVSPLDDGSIELLIDTGIRRLTLKTTLN